MRVPYHIGPANNYSLSRVSYALSDVAVERNERVLSFSCEQPVYCVYTGPSSTSGDCSVAAVEHPIVRALVHVFRGVVDGHGSLQGNKDAELDNLASTLGGAVDWNASVGQTASELLSELITRHPLPNSNHRSSIGLALLYMESSGVDVSLSAVSEHTFNEYIRASKRLLTVRRNTTQFRMLEAAGCDGVMRKNGVAIDFSEYDLSVDDPHTYYYQKHEELSRGFVRTLGDLFGANVGSIQGAGFQSFRDQLDAG